MDTSAISGSSSGASVAGEVQLSLLKKSQDMQASQVDQLLKSTQASSPPNLGNKLDVTS